MADYDILKVGLAQIAPVWLNKKKTLAKVVEWVTKAGEQHCDLVAFGEAILPGYPFWLSLTDGASFNSPVQKEIHAHYMRNAIQIESGDLQPVRELAKKQTMAVYLGTIERPADRGGHSLYCSLVYIDQNGVIQSVHRKLQPTYEERLTWAPGDGAGLCVHQLKQFHVGGLNCWENWMPLSRTALYGQGENVHIAAWPGSAGITQDITRFMALEGRSFVCSVSGLMRKSDIPSDTPHYDEIVEKAPEVLADGGSCIAGPDGKWIIPPVAGREELLIADLDVHRIFQERQNFDIAGHYGRSDVTRLIVDKTRQSIIQTTTNFNAGGQNEAF